ncbi:spore germination protein GerPC [Aneurinibacillus aneurinilyticus]|jgi:spore germination protein PC|nr:spore germination protein GerPC [Aneurinibacillus aneurinilyticus]MCI1694869.1 spore germination protein GerPC [Aneurinibacillus aneurinilyticus]MED0672913.1 spore germination protein GerPC [Aneurinibacillus aneurinilyticus]
MYHGDMPSFFQQIYAHINWQNGKINELEKIIQELKEEIIVQQHMPTDQLEQRVQQLQDEIAIHQQEPINQLATEVHQLQYEISLLKNQRPVIVEKMEYKFDQLKVEKLEGTLNIGVTPNSLGNIDELVTNDQTIEDVPIQPQQSRSFQQIKNHIEQYLKRELPKEINAIEKKYKYKLDKEFHRFVIEDIREQTDRRIHYYLNKMNKDMTATNPETIKQTIIKKVRRDIRAGVESYFSKLSKGEGEL